MPQTSDPDTPFSSQRRGTELARTRGMSEPDLHNPASMFRKKVLIAAFLAVNFALPLSYYVADDPLDERFSWRMFSPIRMVTCQARLVETGPTGSKVVKLTPEVPDVWITWMKRGNERVIRDVASRVCERRARFGPEVAIHSEIACAMPDGSEYRPIPVEEDLCL